MKTVIYARYSSERQNEQSIEGQLRECYAYAKAHGLTVVKEYIDRAISGKAAENREAFQQMITDSDRKAFDVVLVYRTDRFARNRYDSAIYKSRLKRNGVTVLYAKEHIPDGPEGILFESLLEGMAEYYSAELSQKLRRGMRESALKCHATGGNVPLGYKIGADKRFEIDEKTAPVVKKIFEMYAEGNTCKDICDYLNSVGIKTARGNSYNRSSLPTVLRNKKYIGWYICKDICVEGGVPAIVDKELFEAVQRKLEGNRKHPQKKRAKEEYLLTGKLYCGDTDIGMIGHSGTSRNGSRYYYYKPVEKDCAQKTLRKDWIEDLVVNETVRNILQPDMMELIAERCAAISAADSRTDEADTLRQQLKGTEKSINGLLSAMEQGIVTRSTKARLEELERQRDKLEYEIEIVSVKNTVMPKDEIKYLLSRFVRETNEPSEEYNKDIIEGLVYKVFSYEDRIVIVYNIGKSDTELFSSEIHFDPEFPNEGDSDGSLTDGVRPPYKTVSEHITYINGYLVLAVRLFSCSK